MTSKKRRNKKATTTYGIIGLGRFGFALAMELADTDSGLVVLDKDEEKIGALREYTENAYVVRNLEKKTLTETGIQYCDVAVVCIGEQMDTSILTVLNLVGLGVPKVIAKAASAEHGEILEKLGAEVVYPEKDMAIRLAHRLTAPHILEYISLSPEIDIMEIALTDKVAGKTVLELDVRKRFGLNIIAVKQEGKLSTEILPTTVLSAVDSLTVIGKTEAIHRFENYLQS